jgi:hypothetical protein
MAYYGPIHEQVRVNGRLTGPIEVDIAMGAIVTKLQELDFYTYYSCQGYLDSEFVRTGYVYMDSLALWREWMQRWATEYDSLSRPAQIAYWELINATTESFHLKVMVGKSHVLIEEYGNYPGSFVIRFKPGFVNRFRALLEES